VVSRARAAWYRAPARRGIAHSVGGRDGDALPRDMPKAWTWRRQRVMRPDTCHAPGHVACDRHMACDRHVACDAREAMRLTTRRAHMRMRSSRPWRTTACYMVSGVRCMVCVACCKCEPDTALCATQRSARLPSRLRSAAVPRASSRRTPAVYA
jgi:hypothetical protein